MPQWNMPFEKALGLMLGLAGTMPPETVPLAGALDRVLAEDVYAETDIPPFDRSPYDGYAFRREDTASATRGNPAVLRIIEEIPAGSFPEKAVGPGMAAKILTGGPLPEGADTVIKYELTEFDENCVRIFEPVSRRDIVSAGEDMRRGELLARRGDLVEPAVFGALAAQGIMSVKVYKVPRAGLLSTGDELVEAEESISGGKIRDSNRYSIEGVLRRAGAEPLWLGKARDRAADIAELLEEGLWHCDIVFSTGGVSVGDYDATPEAMALCGADVLVHRVDLKPGGACAYGVRDGKLIFALSGNPAASMINFYAVALPCLRKLRGLREYENRELTVRLRGGLRKPSVTTRVLRGKLVFAAGTAEMELLKQGSGAVYSMMGCDLLALVPAGSPGLEPGTELKAFWIG